MKGLQVLIMLRMRSLTEGVMALQLCKKMGTFSGSLYSGEIAAWMTVLAP